MKSNFLIGISTSSLVTIYPLGMTFFKLCLCAVLGIALWKAITRRVKKRTVKQKFSDYLGQIVLSIISAFVIKKYIDLESDFEFLLAGFVSGLFSYGLLLLYRWLTSPNFTDFVKNKYIKK